MEFRKRARKRLLQPFREYQSGNIDDALNAFMNRLSLETKQRLFPRDFLYKLLNVNMTNNQKIAALGALMNLKSNNGKLYLPNAIREKIFGKVTSYSDKITNNESRRKYYTTKLNSASKSNRNTIYRNTAYRAKKYIKNSILYGYSNDYIKILRQNDKNMNNVIVNILKQGYFKMPELKNLKKLLTKSKSNIEYYKKRIKYSKNSSELKIIETEFIKDRINLFETLWNLILNIDYKVRVLYRSEKMLVPHNGLNWNDSIGQEIQQVLENNVENENGVYGHPDQSPDWHIFFFYLFDEEYIKKTILEDYKEYGVLDDNQNVFRENIPWKKYKKFFNSFTFQKNEFSKNNSNTIANIFKHYFKYLSRLYL